MAFLANNTVSVPKVYLFYLAPNALSSEQLCLMLENNLLIF